MEPVVTGGSNGNAYSDNAMTWIYKTGSHDVQAPYKPQDYAVNSAVATSGVTSQGFVPNNLWADLSKATNVKVTYNGNNSFTITSITGIDVYLYA